MRIRFEDMGPGGPDDKMLQFALELEHKRLARASTGVERSRALAAIARMELKAAPKTSCLQSPPTKPIMEMMKSL